MSGPLIRERTLEAFSRLDKKLKTPLKLLVAGEAAMTLCYNVKEGTQDVDAVTFQGLDSLENLKKEIQEVGREMQIDADWINPYFGNFAIVLPADYATRLRSVFQGKFLEALVLGPEDLLIMKLFAGRPKDDAHIRKLLKHEKMDLPFVEKHLENLIGKRIPKANDALDRFDEYLEDLGLD